MKSIFIPSGYRLMTVSVDNNKAKGYDVFAEGWLKDGKSRGRPVDVLVLEDRSLLISDDKADILYRIYYEGEGSNS